PGGGGQANFLVDSGAWNGQVNLSWSARLPNGDPVPAGMYTLVVDARLGQNSFTASQPVRVTHGSADTLPHRTSLPGYQYPPAKGTVQLRRQVRLSIVRLSKSGAPR